MLTASFKVNKLTVVSVVCSLVTAAVFVTVFLIFSAFQPQTAEIKGLGKYSLCVSDKEETENFFAQFGLKVDFSKSREREIIIPSEFDELYNEYNSLQKSQGLDLSKHKGENALQRIYPIVMENNQECYAVLIVIDGKVAGGHINIGGIEEPLLNFAGESVK